jgi:hypothetical protein
MPLVLKDGFELQCFRLSEPVLPMSAIASALDKAQSLGLIERDLQKVRPTERGFDMLSDLQALFLPQH